ncbi:MAG: FKBP-type peptidyl-prolyl cis-trans isomerase [Nanoarchaeota archaeon]|nr:FKBP-type peptidyl-prolyl cis-trans isomerase [Nanoarchaeota archaeon]
MIKKGDFVRLNYTGSADGHVYDTTVEATAKKEEIYSPKTKYGPVVVVIGERHLIKGLDEGLVGKEAGKHSFDIKDVDAFGKKDAKKLQLVPMKLFAKENIRPFAGLQVNIDDTMGIVRSVSGGRVIVDFNHPLSSKDVHYDVEVEGIIT